MVFKVRQTPPPAFGQAAPQPVFEDVQKQIEDARYPSELRGKRLAPNMARLLLRGEITPEQFDATMQQAADKRQAMRPSSVEPPEGPPESVVMPAAPGTPEWSPTANLGEPRTDFDPAELAAGEHLDRQR
ncbi:MAG TPA: hypothetical protein VGE30_01465 [Candidatus Saccharimonadales bacterium]